MNFNYIDMMISNIIEQSVKQILLPRVSCISCNNSLDYLDELYTIIKEHYENMFVDLVFKDGTVLTLAGSEKLPYSVEFIKKVVFLFSL